MTNDKFTIPFIEFINSNFDVEKNKFIIIDINKEFDCDISNINNAFIFNEYEFNDLIKNSKQIILHSLFMGTNKFYMQLLKNRKILYKFNWVIWGADLYYFKKTNFNIKQKMINSFKKYVIRKFGYITTLVKNDYELAKKYCKVTGKYRPGMYVNPVKLDYLENILKYRNEHSCVNIQIGNSANPSNNHIEIIHKLSRYKDENINIYVPLSYSGDREYIELVKKEGKKIFENKFIPITEFMNPQEYGKFLGGIDIAIFNNDRQQALGNIFALSYLGAKIYMRNNTTMWSQLVVDEGYKFSSVDSIDNFKFYEFIDQNYHELQVNKRLSRNRFDDKYIAKVWEKIFHE